MCKKIASCLQPGVSWHIEIDESITECVNRKHPFESSLKSASTKRLHDEQTS